MKGYIALNKKKQKNSTSQLMLVLAGGLIAILLAYFAESSMLSEESPAPAQPAAHIRINELMSRNDTALIDNTGAYSDWLEIINDENSPVDLTGWQLSTLDSPLAAFIFPDVTLSPGQCLLVYASGQDVRDSFHAPFKLSASGETVLLTDPFGVQADSVELPALSANEVWARDTESGGWNSSSVMTPGLSNHPENAAERAVMEDDIILSEIIASNSSLTEGGHDLIELHNTGIQAVTLSGYSLTDDPGQPRKYVLGDVSIEAGGYLLIEADGQSVPFRLSAEGEEALLYNPAGHLVSSAAWNNMEADQSLSFTNDEWALSVPTPGLANTPESAALLDGQLTAANSTGLFISEILASSSESSEYDWVELYNATSAPINLAGYGLSDNPNHPRKWQFPEGAMIAPESYLVVLASGKDTLDTDGNYHTGFSLSCTSPETVTLCTPDGAVFDRACASEMYGDISYGRIPGKNGYFYLSMSTPGRANSVQGFRTRAEKPLFSADGGIYESGETLTLTLSAQEGMTIRYTLDSTTPTESSPEYEGPITITDTTVVRAAAFGADAMRSYTETQTYLFGADHTVRVISVVSDPEGLFSEKTGIMVLGKDVIDADPYTGANFWNNWEREANVEIFETDGTTLLDQACGLRLHGTNSRKRPQKAFCLTARMSYDEDNRFRAELFSERDYSEYHSFVLRSGGQDDEMTRIHDSVITQLASDTENLYQESELCVVYLNGEYWGQYDMREKINRFSIAQYENWDADDAISIVKGSYNILRGSNKHYEALLEWLQAHPDATDEDIAYVETQVDLDNYLDYIALMVYSGNQDIGMRRYMNADTDNLWRWVIFDMDYAFYNDTDSMRRWMDPAGAGTHNRTDNSLFVYVMKNESVKDRFLTRFGQLLTGPWAAEKMIAMIQAQYEAMLPEMQAHYEKWPGSCMEKWQQYIKEMLDYAATREEKVIGYTQQHFSLTDAEMQKYFGGS